MGDSIAAPLVESTYVSPTALDSYRYFLNSDWIAQKRGLGMGMTQEEFVRQILRLEPPTPAMQIGIEFHQMFEDAGKQMMSGGKWTPSDERTIYDFNFRIDGGWRIQIPSVVEMPARREFEVVVPPPVTTKPGLVQPQKYRVTMSGRLDAVCGQTGVDYKTTRSTIDAEPYQDAMQWRAYMFLLPSMPDFRYEVFRLRDGGDLNQIDVVEHRSFTMTRYPGVDGDVMAAVGEYLAFLQAMERRGWLRITDYGVEPWNPPPAPEKSK